MRNLQRSFFVTPVWQQDLYVVTDITSVCPHASLLTGFGLNTSMRVMGFIHSLWFCAAVGSASG